MISLSDNVQILVISKKLVNKLHSVDFITSLWLGITQWITNEISNFVTCSNNIRPLQINSLFPVHRPHLVTVSYKYSIIPYSSIIFRLFLHTDRLSKSHLKTGSAHVSAVLSSRHKLHVFLLCYFCSLKGKEQA